MGYSDTNTNGTEEWNSKMWNIQYNERNEKLIFCHKDTILKNSL